MAKAASGSEKPAKKSGAKSAGETAGEQPAAQKPATAKKTAAAKKTTGSATPAKTPSRGKAAAGAGAAGTAAGGASAKVGKASTGSGAGKTAKASGGAGAKKTGARASAGQASGGTSAAGGGAPGLREHMRDFASARADGWGHDDWLAFLDELHGRGHDVSDHHAIGRQLESERLSLMLERMPELSPRQVSALVERFETLWSLRNAQASEVAGVRGVSEDLAERVLEAVRQG